MITEKKSLLPCHRFPLPKLHPLDCIHGHNTLNRRVLRNDLGPALATKKTSEFQFTAKEAPLWKEPLKNWGILCKEATYVLCNLSKGIHLLQDSVFLSIKWSQ